MMNKSQVVLYMYDRLIRRKVIRTNDILNQYDISLRTFQRYIAEINDFFFNNFMNCSVAYNYENKYYYLKEER